MIRSLLLALVLSATLSAAPPPLKISTPRNLTVGSAPLFIRLAITLEPDARNRWLCLYVRQVRGGSEEKTSCWDVQADKEARTTWKDIKDLGAGEWDIVAAILRNDEQSVMSNRIHFTVIGIGYDPEM